MKQTSYFFLLFLLGTVFHKPLFACHSMPLVNFSVVSSATGITINATQDVGTDNANCSVGSNNTPFYLEVELNCISASSFTGNLPICGTGSGWNAYPFYHSLLNIPNYTLANNYRDQFAVQEPYTPIFIPYTDLCPGTTYYLRAREFNCGNNVPFMNALWTTPVSFTTPGASPTFTLDINSSVNTSICEGRQVTLSGNILTSSPCAGLGNPVFNWTCTPSQPFFPGYGSSITFTPVSSCTVTLKASGGILNCYNVDSTVFSIQVRDSIAPIAPLDDITQCDTGAVVLNALNTGASYLWSTGDTSQTIAVTTSGLYSVTITDTNGCVTTDSSHVRFGTAPVVDLGIDTTVCSGALVLNAQNPESTYLWNDSTTSQTLTVLTGGTYTVTVTDSIGCIASDTINITVNALPEFDLGADTTLCDTILTLDAGNSGTTYLWNNNSTAQILDVITSDLYTVTVTDSNGCKATDSIVVKLRTLPGVDFGPDRTYCGNLVLDAQNVIGSTYLWNDSSTADTLVVTTSGTYFVTVTDSTGCAGIDTINIIIATPPIVDLGEDTTQCQGSILIDAGNNGITYLWSDSTMAQTLTVSNSGSYWVIVSDSNGCTASDTVNIVIGVAVNLGSDQAQCGSSYTLDAGNPGAVYLWNDNTTAQTLTITASGTYYVEVTDTNGCIGSDTINLTLNPLPVATLNLPLDSICDNSNAIILSGGMPAGGIYLGIGIVNDTILDPFVVPIGNQTITYSYTDTLGCTGNASEQVYFDNCSGVEELLVDGSVSLFPNPANGLVTLQINTPVATEIAIEIFSMEGRLLVQQRVNSTGQIILPVDISQLANGVYSVRVTGENGLSSQIKLVKQD